MNISEVCGRMRKLAESPLCRVEAGTIDESEHGTGMKAKLHDDLKE